MLSTRIQRLLLALQLLALVFAPITYADVKVQPEKLAKQKWVRAKTDHFVIYSDQGSKKAKKLATKLELFRIMVNKITLFKSVPDAKPVKVIATKRKNTLKWLKNDSANLKEAAGFFTQTESGPYAVIDASGSTELESIPILLHEYVHYLSATQLFAKLPAWYNEGIAEYFGNTKIRNQGKFDVGDNVDSHMLVLRRYGWLPFEDLMTKGVPFGSNVKKIWKFYAQSWFLTRYFEVDSIRHAQLSNYFKLISEGAVPSAALQQAMGKTFEELGKDVKTYFWRRRYPRFSIDFSSEIATIEVSVETVESDELLFELGEYFLNGVSAHDLAKTVFQHSLKLNPNNARAMAGLAKINMLDNLNTARLLIEKALTLEPDNYWVATVAGHIFARLYFNSLETKKDLKLRNLAVRNYNKAMSAPVVLVEPLYGASELTYADKDWNKTKVICKRAFDYAPTLDSIRLKLYEAYIHLGETKQANALEKLILGGAHYSNEYKDWLSKSLEKIKQNCQTLN